MPLSLSQKLVAEFVGTLFLLTAIVGSGVMASRIAEGNAALALLANALATGAILVVMIGMFGRISGAHFNPAVTLAFLLSTSVPPRTSVMYVLAQLAGAVAGVVAAHVMFEMSALTAGQAVRSGAGLLFAEAVATFGLVLTILVTARCNPGMVAVSVGLYIASACWFTASTSFANPAVTVARMLTDTYIGIRPDDVLAFILAQLVAVPAAVYVASVVAPVERQA